MATPTLTAAPATVPFGQAAEVSVAFSTDPGATHRLEMFEDGVKCGEATVSFDAEPTPGVVFNGVSGSGWELRASGGTLVQAGPLNGTLAR